MVEGMFLRYFTADSEFPFFIQYGEHGRDLFVHRHEDFTELVVVLKGSALHQVNQDVYPIAKGDVFVIAGDSAHGYQDTRDLEICNIMFPQGFLDGRAAELRTLPGYQALFVIEPFLAKNYSFTARLHLEVADQQWTEAAIARMVREYTARGPGWRTLLEGLFCELVVHLCRWYQDLESPEAGDPIQVAKAVAFMEANFHRNLSLEDIAAQACLSPRHFSRLFGESHGLSPHKFLLNMRMRHACELLDQHRDLPISEVAARCGFEDSNHFSRQFSRLMGMSPRSYRSRLG